MATYYASITDEQAALIRSAPLFFVASVAPNLAKGPNDVGPVNLSPKGGVRLHILSPTRVAYLDYPGSGNETAAHVDFDPRMTVMFCAFEGAPVILLIKKVPAGLSIKELGMRCNFAKTIARA